jgi:ubiquinone/menaquinone biosynthesis C-methylase UbiE
LDDAVPPDALRASYDRSAASYDERFSGIQRTKHDAVLARITVPGGARVLDVGCGTGLLAARLERVRVVGIDLSSGMLERARDRLLPVQGSALALPFRDGSFELVFAVTSLLVPARDLARGLVELRRVARPGARIAITLLRETVPADFTRELRACGLELEAEAFPCGQDLGWIAFRP